MNIVLTYVDLALLVLVALWTVHTSLLRAAIGLALVSVLLTLLMFAMGAPLAGVFELSVCAGLITAIFISTISLTGRPGQTEAARLRRSHARRFLPVILVAAAVGVLLWLGPQLGQLAPAGGHELDDDLRRVLWSARRLELVGQLIILFVGVFAVVILFKEQKHKELGE